MRALERWEKGAHFIEDVLQQAFAQAPLTGPDRGLVQELIYGVVRRRATLDWLIARKTDDRRQSTLVRLLLRLGLYQIFWLDRIPDHAAVHETVEMAKGLGLGAKAGFVNAVLRNCLRERKALEQALEDLKSRQPAVGYSHPDWLLNRWTARWGKADALRLMQWNNTPSCVFARVNTLRTDPKHLVELWREEGVECDPFCRDWIPENLVFELKNVAGLPSLPSFQRGLFYLQDPSTLLAAEELNPQPGEDVLDLCAAPGGKTTYIAQIMRNQGRIVAHDTQPDRLALLRENCTRLGVTCVEDLNEPIPSPLPGGELGTGTTNEARLLGGDDAGDKQASSEQAAPVKATTHHASRIMRYDRILVDAPCSNTGVMRRRVDLRWRIRPEEIERLRKIQIDLLCATAPRLKPGGILVYSTCSLEPEENRGVVEQFLAKHCDFTLERERELLPFADGVDGAYVVRLRHSNS
ncbi:MAG: 16S rRNA (cytosine(967)-C(5))-methyltransferase RsmB [Verrucomicrobia bacterium]|nr:16S rRNA (cytosine(967)-C(5))-methyltransferase RsmB [Verrucomicrobiota bacterium]